MTSLLLDVCNTGATQAAASDCAGSDAGGDEFLGRCTFNIVNHYCRAGDPAAAGPRAAPPESISATIGPSASPASAAGRSGEGPASYVPVYRSDSARGFGSTVRCDSDCCWVACDPPADVPVRACCQRRRSLSVGAARAVIMPGAPFRRRRVRVCRRCERGHQQGELVR